MSTGWRCLVLCRPWSARHNPNPSPFPRSGHDLRKKNESAALIYFHGGDTVGSVDEFENDLRIVAEESGAVIVGVEYQLALERSLPIQLDDYDSMINWVQGDEGRKRGISPDQVCGGGDSAGGNMTAAASLHRKVNRKKPLKAQLLCIPKKDFTSTLKKLSRTALILSRV